MDITEAASMARTLMNQHGLGGVPFKWNRGKRLMGQCVFISDGFTQRVREISLSQHFVPLLPEDEVRDIILHEIAHAIAGPKAGHGPVWRVTARRIGAQPVRCRAASQRPDSKYVSECPNGHLGAAHRLPLRVKTCGKCSKTFNLDYIISYREGDRWIPISSMPPRYQQEYTHQQTRKAASDLLPRGIRYSGT